MDYFRLFNMPKKFKIDKKLLTKNYYQLQLQYHPDLFINDSDSKKKIVLEKSIQINKGYKILKDFLTRATYLLILQGFKVKKETILLKNKKFLIKYFSLYEELDDLKKNNFNKVEVNYFFLKIEKKIENYEKEIEKAFEDKNFEKVIKIIEKLLFFRKFKINFKKQQNIYLKKTN